ncbi:MAG: hypothetical protein KDD60_13240, partial [Bdellovibrionales bacterium]|nr:hypothetical protein [Bdellovibrionales bacterium]
MPRTHDKVRAPFVLATPRERDHELRFILPATGIVRSELSKAKRQFLAGSMCCPSGRLPDIFNVLQYRNSGNRTMREYLEIVGGVPLRGIVPVSGAKNAALPLLIASLLTPEECTFRRVPNLEDTNLTLRLLEHFGCAATFSHPMTRAPEFAGESARLER